MTLRMHYVVGTFALLIPVYLTVSDGAPSLLSPYSLPVAIPGFLLGRFSLSIIPGLFAVWSFPLVKGQKGIPVRSLLLAMMLIVLSIFFLVFAWGDGVVYQGQRHAIFMCCYNLVLWGALLALFILNQKHKSYSTNFLFHWVLFAWLSWASFPWLGEMI